MKDRVIIIADALSGIGKSLVFEFFLTDGSMKSETSCEKKYMLSAEEVSYHVCLAMVK